MTLDKYARDYAIWRSWAAIDYRAAQTLFDVGSGDPFLYFPAATLGHHALEMYLKSALIVAGMTIFDPRKVGLLDPPVNLAAADCAWGHDLVALGKQFAARASHFDLSARMKFMGFLTIREPMTVEEGLKIFDPFFAELRYPQELNQVSGLGHEHRVLLKQLVGILRYARGRSRIAVTP